MKITDSTLEMCKKSEKQPHVLALGYQDDNGYIVVTDVLCMNFPNLSKEQKADLSFKLSTYRITHPPS